MSPLSAEARLGRDIFFDVTLSASGQLACASCHSPDRAYGPPPGTHSVTRAIPSLRYVDRVPAFTVGPATGDESPAPPVPVASAVPRGGLFWDGRASTLQSQAMSPLLGANEMANGTIDAAAAKLRRAYGARLAALFGPAAISTADLTVADAMFAVARFELEDSSFHPYSSKYDAYLEGKAALAPNERRGLAVFEDPARGNCAACHPSRQSPDGLPPTFSDYEYEALGVPRDTAATVNRDATHFDLGLCGPQRTDMMTASHYCGMFRTPSLRNATTRMSFFHNGVYHSLDQVIAFYAFRDAQPDRIYPRGADGGSVRYNDVPVAFRANVDTADRPFGHSPREGPALSDADMRDLVAFLSTLTDGFRRVP